MATGDWITAGWVNTYIGTNLAANWPGVAAGDMEYYLSSVEKARLAKPASLGMLKMTSAGVPSWLTIGSAFDVPRVASGGATLEFGYPRHKFALVSNSGAQIIPATGSYLNILWNTNDIDAYGWHSISINTERVIPTIAGYYIGFLHLSLPTSGMPFNVEIYKNNSTLVGAIRSDVRSGFLSSDQAFSKPVSLNGTTDYLNAKIQQNDPGTQNLGAGSWFHVWRIE